VSSKTSQQENKDNFYEDLKWKILTMQLAPSSDLDEVRFSEQYGLSRTPVRDVFRRMAGEGFVEIVGNRGASVASMDHKSLKGFVQSAPLIYTSVIRLAVKNATSSQVRDLKRAQTKYRNAVRKDSISDIVIYDDRFHCLMGKMADNHYLSASLQRLLIDHARISHSFLDLANAEHSDLAIKTVLQHDQMIDAIESGNEEEAVLATLAHWKLSKQQTDIFVNPEAIPVELMAS